METQLALIKTCLAKLEQQASDAEKRFAEIETFLAKLEQKTDNRQTRLEKSVEEMLSMFTDFMSATRLIQATETRSNTPTHFYDEVESPPPFDGVDPIGWIIRANLYFETHPTPEKDKVECALVCMESFAPHWANWVRLNQPDLTWARLCGTLVERYDGRFKGDLIERICSLRDTGDIEKYIGDFIGVITQLRGLPDSHCVGYLLHGLRLKVRTKLRAQRPKKLQEAISLARDIEEEDTGPGLFKLRGRIGEQEVIVLIASGSNYNCISPSMADRLNLKRYDASSYKGRVGGGKTVDAKGFCRGVKLILGSCSFDVDLFVFDNGSADVILGGAWMRRLGQVELDFGKSGMSMSFDWDGAHHCLKSERGLTKGPEWGSITLLKEENGSLVVA